MTDRVSGSPTTVLDDLIYLTTGRTEQKQFAECVYLAERVWSALGMSPNTFSDRKEGVIKGVLQAVAAHTAEQTVTIDLEKVADRSKHTVFQCMAAAELLGLVNEGEEYFLPVRNSFAIENETTWDELRSRPDNRGPSRTRLLRAGVWIGTSGKTAGGVRHKLLAEFDAALNSFLRDDRDTALAVAQEALEDQITFVQTSVAEELKPANVSSSEAPKPNRETLWPSLQGAPVPLHPEIHKAREQLAKSLEERLCRVTASRQFDSRLEVSYVTAAEITFDHWSNIGSPDPLDLSGKTSRIAETFLKVSSGRLVVLGDAGSGKSMLVHQLSTSLMKLYKDAQIRLLPVSLTLSAFDSRSTPFERWLVDELATHLDGRKKRRRRKAGQLIREGAILLILDGFDETAESNASVVFDQIRRWMNDNQASLVLASRSTEYSRVVSGSGYLTGAAAIEIQPLSIESVEAYLPYTAPKVEHQGEIVPSWHPVLERLKEPEGDVAATRLLGAITTPLDVSLARAAYSDPQSDPSELLNAGRFQDAADLRDHLFAQYVDAMGVSFVSKKTGLRDVRRVQQFRRWLGWLAIRATLRGERNLSWWRSITYELDRAAALTSVFIGLVVTVVLGVSGVDDPVVFLLACAASFGPAVGLLLPPRRLRFTRWKPISEMRRVQVIDGLLLLVSFFAAGVIVTTTTTISDRYLRWSVPEVLAMYALVPFAIVGLYLTPPIAVTEGSPRDAFRHDCIAALWRATLYSVGFFFMIYSSWRVADVTVDFGRLAWICAGVFAATSLASSAGGFMAASLYLKLAVRTGFYTAEFWDIAHRHDVLRKIGPQYQFRHRFLQERLAQSYLEDPVARIGKFTRIGSQAQLMFQARYVSDPDQVIAQLEQLVEQARKRYFFRSRLILGVWFMLITVMHTSEQYGRALKELDKFTQSGYYRRFSWRTSPVVESYRLKVCLLLDVDDVEAAKDELRRYISVLRWRPSLQARQEAARAKKQLDDLSVNE